MGAPVERHLGGKRTALYRLYDASDRLLYVGISADPEKRWKGHSVYSSRWWKHVAKRVVEWHDDRYLALAHEYLAILRERPVHNRRRTPPHTTLWPNRTAAALLADLPRPLTPRLQ
ncbi:GIY-YIG nuclease family protein [Streptomyces noursei]|uniref:GIY-YIG nuclease family protein n=1 Tax=Streptomyces noursei TaxID=1971 RepID=UPI001676781A|nr:hypothetical protein GCM10010341_72850 [Streptomyces noursei]